MWFDKDHDWINFARHHGDANFICVPLFITFYGYSISVLFPKRAARYCDEGKIFINICKCCFKISILLWLDYFTLFSADESHQWVLNIRFYGIKTYNDSITVFHIYKIVYRRNAELLFEHDSLLGITDSKIKLKIEKMLLLISR